MNPYALVGDVQAGHVCTEACDARRYSDGVCPTLECEQELERYRKMIHCARCGRFGTDTYAAFVKHLHYGQCDRMVAQNETRSQ